MKAILPFKPLDVLQNQRLCVDLECCLLRGSVSFPSFWVHNSHILNKTAGPNGYWVNTQTLVIHLVLALCDSLEQNNKWKALFFTYKVIALTSWVQHTWRIHPACSTGLVTSTRSVREHDPFHPLFTLPPVWNGAHSLFWSTECLPQSSTVFSYLEINSSKWKYLTFC